MDGLLWFWTWSARDVSLLSCGMMRVDIGIPQGKRWNCIVVLRLPIILCFFKITNHFIQIERIIRISIMPMHIIMHRYLKAVTALCVFEVRKVNFYLVPRSSNVLAMPMHVRILLFIMVLCICNTIWILLINVTIISCLIRVRIYKT